MNYIYDIVLNFNKDYFEFFQWKKGDKIINVKKIPAFKVSDETLKSFKYNVVRVDKEFINKISDLTLFYNKMDNNYKYICLVSNNNETIGLMFDKDGNLIKRSSLVFDEEEEVNEELVKEQDTIIKFLENKLIKIEYVSRVEREKRDYLLKFINNLDIEKDSNILKYIYYDCFEEEEDDVLKIKNVIFKELYNINGNKDKLYGLVNVLKKIKKSFQ